MDKFTQYILIDFLRLFRLCVNLGYIKRKRKSPIDSSNPVGSNRRLFSDFLKSLFGTVRNKRSSHYVVIQENYRNVLSALNLKQRAYFTNAGEEGEEAFRKFGELKQNLKGFVVPNFPGEILIREISKNQDSKYNLISSFNNITNRPSFSFYDCAKACLEYKQKFDNYMPLLVEFFTKEEQLVKIREEEQIKAKKERRQKERERLEKEKQNLEKPISKEELEQQQIKLAEAKRIEEEKKLEEERILQEKLEEEKQLRLSNAQNAFNMAKERYISNGRVNY